MGRRPEWVLNISERCTAVNHGYLKSICADTAGFNDNQRLGLIPVRPPGQVPDMRKRR